MGQWSKNTSHKKTVTYCNTETYLPIGVPGLSTKSPSSTTRTSSTLLLQASIKVPQVHRHKMRTSTQHWESGCTICQQGWITYCQFRKKTTDTQPWYKIWPLNGCNPTRVKPNLDRSQKEFTKVLQAVGKAERRRN